MENSSDTGNKFLDTDAFETLFRREFKGLCFFAVNYVKDLTTAREIVQDAFISLWEKRLTIDPERQVKSYLSTTIRNKCLNYLRDKQKFHPGLMDLENLEIEGGHEQSDVLDARELDLKIQAALAALPERCREIFILSRFEHLKYQEIADKLQISVKTVETQMSKALQHMRTSLGEYLSLILILLSVWNEH